MKLLAIIVRSMEELLCPICYELLHRPHSLNPCEHIFCEPCLRRLNGAKFRKCPLCRSPIKGCYLDEGKTIFKDEIIEIVLEMAEPVYSIATN